MIKVQNGKFIDESGRTLILRGVNLGGSSKVPTTPNGATWNKDGFYNHREISFVGRPFPLDQADEHFGRLKSWGFTFLRYLVTWEAIEHAGPGIYDQDYLECTYQIIRKANEYGISVFIDPHQDVWSRFTGGDGAPVWTLEAAGMDPAKLHRAGAAFVHQESGDPYPRMIWSTNYNKLAAATMFTLFFAGRDFAPDLKVEGVSIQDYLQNHYFNAIKQVAEKLKELPNVIGYDTLNEPSCGYIGQADLNGQIINKLCLGAMPTFFQSMALGSGYPQEVEIYKLGIASFVKDGKKTLNTAGESIWSDGCEDPWKHQGVWKINSDGKPVFVKSDYFSSVHHHPVNFNRDYFKPFANRFAAEVRSVDPRAIIFVEEIPSLVDLTWGSEDADQIVLAAHWYDNLTLVKKTFLDWFTIDTRSMKIVLGKQRVRSSFSAQIADLSNQAEMKMNHAPVLIGEVGIPFDLNDKKAYRTGDDSDQIQAMDATMYALESNFVAFTLWNYTADNSNPRGDQWNDEDLSLFSRDQMTGSGDINDGGRALKAAVRPYPQKVAGDPISMSFDIASKKFQFSFHGQPEIESPTEVYIPQIQYPNGCRVELSDGGFELDQENQLLTYRPSRQFEIHTIIVTPV
jgi:hypothetical protein